MLAETSQKKSQLTAEEEDGGPPETQVSLAEDLDDPRAMEEDHFIGESYPMRRWEFKLPFCSEPVGGTVSFNPVVSVVAMGIIWGLAGYCMADPDGSLEKLANAKAWVTEYTTSFIIGTTPLFLIFMIYLYFVFGDAKLGKKNDKPEFSAPSFFAMIFSAGVAVGLFFFGVSEPLWHLASHRFAATQYRSQDEIATYAMNLTIFHWGLSAWIGYLIVGVAAGIARFRYDLPLTIRSTLYPLLGDYTWGWIGDMIDAFSIVTVVSGICTSLGLGAIQIIQGLEFVDALDLKNDDEVQNARIIAIVVVTLVATISVVTGLNFGIKTLSNVALILSLGLMFMIILLDKTEYLANLFVAQVGYYFQWSIFQLNFQTDAFSQLTSGQGRAIDGRSGWVGWMNAWTIFYWAWWRSWSSFVGTFLARISRGRTIREMVHYTMLGPVLYVFFWFVTFGGSGLRMDRRAKELEDLGELQFGDPLYYAVTDNGIQSKFCFNPPTEAVTLPNASYTYVNDQIGVGPVCKFDTGNDIVIWFQLLDQYYNFGTFLSWVSIFAIAIYFVTSSDSGSLVVDMLASNGEFDHHYSQRIFWAFTEGALAIALLIAGDQEALQALQAISIVFGLPFNILMCFMCVALYRVCEDEKYKTNYNEFSLPVYGGMWNLFEHLPSAFGLLPRFSHPDRAFMKLPDETIFIEFLRGLFLPMWSFFIVTSRLHAKPKHRAGNLAITITVAVLFLGWVALFSSVASDQRGMWAFGWLCYFAQASIIAGARFKCRGMYNIRGNFIEDFLASFFLYAQVLSQMVLCTDEHTSSVDESSDGASA